MEELIRDIRAAEAEGAGYRAEAERRAQETEAEGAAAAQEIRRRSEEECKRIFSGRQAAAREQAEKEYAAYVAARQTAAQEESDELSLRAEGFVGQIVRRVCGDC